MNDVLQPQRTPPAPPGAPVPEDASILQARVKELKTENERLLRLVGELLVANQRLREQRAAATNPSGTKDASLL
jgi:hypothetical protein